MATLVLSTVGTALGGPIGSAIGALIGQSIDQQLLSPPRRGPRVGDLSVQTSSYGTQVPRIYGRMRVAGSVVWSTDLIEHEGTGGAKGQPDVSYAYTVSMAVALSSRQASSIKRIWADGKLLRGEAGDLKVGGAMRFLDGSEDQAVDPLIASIEGIGNTPAYRGLALAIFEDLELADFGNRIPFLTFEIEGDSSSPAVGAVLGDGSAGMVICSAEDTISGFAAYGSSIKHAIETLVGCFGLDLFDDGAVLRSSDNATLTVCRDELGSSASEERNPISRREQMPLRALPSHLRLSFYDPERDFQTGEAIATAGENGGAEERREFAGALFASDAKAMAQRMIARAWSSRDTLRLYLPPHRLGLEPGSHVSSPGSTSTWTVQKVIIDGFVVIVELKPLVAGSVAMIADSGRVAPNSDVQSGPVSIALIDIPALSPTAPTVLLAASSPTAGWKGAVVSVTVAGQEMPVRTAVRKSILGSAVTALAEADPSAIDTVSTVEVQLIDHEQWLNSRDDEALAAGANVALIGGEVVQFGNATPLGSGRFKLDRFLRGRAGTVSAVPGHSIGEVFCIIDAGSLRSIALPVSSIGKEVTAQIAGGDSASVIVSPRADAIASPSGGMNIDEEARASIDRILATLRQGGLIGT